MLSVELDPAGLLNRGQHSKDRSRPSSEGPESSGGCIELAKARLDHHPGTRDIDRVQASRAQRTSRLEQHVWFERAFKAASIGA